MNNSHQIKAAFVRRVSCYGTDDKQNEADETALHIYLLLAVVIIIQRCHNSLCAKVI